MSKLKWESHADVPGEVAMTTHNARDIVHCTSSGTVLLINATDWLLSLPLLSMDMMDRMTTYTPPPPSRPQPLIANNRISEPTPDTKHVPRGRIRLWIVLCVVGGRKPFNLHSDSKMKFLLLFCRQRVGEFLAVETQQPN